MQPPEANDLLRNPANTEVILPAIGGEDVNTDPRQEPPEFVISFGQRTLEEAARWPDVLKLVVERAKPERDAANDATADGAHRKKYWWQHAQPRPELYAALAGLPRALVTACVSKHLMFSFQPTDRVFTHALYVFPLPSAASFAVLQSRIHAAWTFLLSSSMGRDNQLRYAASDCFETFPFPRPNPRENLPAVESVGERLYAARAQFMLGTNQGLTKTYNALKDPACEDARVLELRRLHEEMDRAVLAAYGWSDIAVPPYCPMTDADRASVQAFEDEVIDRLYVLNAERAAEERRSGVGAKTRAKAVAEGDGEEAEATDAAAPKKRAAKGKKPAGDQGKLF